MNKLYVFDYGEDDAEIVSATNSKQAKSLAVKKLLISGETLLHCRATLIKKGVRLWDEDTMTEFVVRDVKFIETAQPEGIVNWQTAIREIIGATPQKEEGK